MSKKDKISGAPASAPATEGQVAATAAPKEPKAPSAMQTAFTHSKKLALVGAYTPESAITWLIEKNPRMPGRATYDRFQKYLGAATVKAYTEAGGTKGDLLWDLRSGFLSIEGVTLGGDLTPRKPKLPPKPKAEKKEKVASDAPAKVAAAEDGMKEEKID